MKRQRLPDRAATLIVLMMEARSERMWTNTAVKRVVKACAVLGIEGHDLLRILQWLGIADHVKGNPYQKSIVRIWP